MNRTLTVVAAGALCLLLTSFAPGRPPAPPLNPDGKREDVPPPQLVTDPRDPTQTSADLRDALGTVKGAGSTAPKLPLILIKGRIIAKGKPPAVLVSVENSQPVLISKGSVLTGPGNVTLKVKDLTRTEVLIEVPQLNETIVLR